ncbi:chromosome transmission fidelity protein 8 homolog [Bactrocera dorsalis]|uniref:Chromosome transmission fidelity protein 8 homolog n=2 Tax=Bactrocera dorsalis TaxID=27457 RepID=A0A6I9W7J6_BACDO|nr:chromosome transmission fidelity protein 8 homolog [Bactrocera dorsalis]
MSKPADTTVNAKVLFRCEKLLFLFVFTLYSKMPILIKTSSPTTLEEYAIVELQGDLEIRSGENIHNLFIGDLYYNKYGQPILIIGHHILQGREQKLEKPFAVLEKLKSKDGKSSLNDTNMDSNATLNRTIDCTILDSTVALENKSRQNTEYVVRALCTKKLIFKSRPKPIIANVATSV